MGECFFWYRLTRVVPDRTEGRKTIVVVFMMEPRAKIKNRMGDRWRRLGYEILLKIILTWNYVFIFNAIPNVYSATEP